MSICSSWNTDRVAACCLVSRHPVSAQKKVVKMYTEIRSNFVAVKTYRRAVRFAHEYEAKVLSAHLGDNGLVVELANGSTYEYARIGDKFVLTGCSLPKMVAGERAIASAA